MKYRRDIDGLRAMAVIPVMLFHAGVPIFPGGFVGVDVFFVISGYLISTLIIQDLRQGSFSLVVFYERRVRRIMPALVIIMLFSVPAAWVLMPPADLKDFTESLAAVTVSLSNVLFWSESGYFATDAELKPLLHTWSLGVEEQFYLLYPIVLVWVHRHRHHGPWLLGMLGLASLAFAQWQVVRHPQAAFFLLPARFWELLAGGLAAFVLLDRPAIISQALRPVGSAIGLLMIVAAALLFDSDLPFPGMSALLPVAGSVLVILCAGPDNFVGRLLGSHPLVGIGLVSYSAYLWHQPLLAFARYREHSLDAGVLGLLLCLLSLILAWFTWRFIERPFRTPGVVSTKNLTRLALVSGVGFIIFGVVGHMTDGFPRQRVSETKQQLLASAIKHPKTKACSTGGWNYRKPKDACVFGDGKMEVAVLGDSHANMLSYPLADVLNPMGISVRQLSFGGCEPSLGEALDTACSAWTKESVDYLKARDEAKTVVIVYRLYSHLHGGHVAAYPAQSNDVDERTRERRWRAYTLLVNELVAAGKRVIVVMPVPEVRRRMNDLIFVADEPATPIVSVSRSWWDGRSAFAQSRLNELSPNALLIDPTALFCDTQSCYATSGKVAYYFDHNHLSATGAPMLASLVGACAKNYSFLPGDDSLPRPGRCDISYNNR